MYLQHFGLKELPFTLTPNTHFFLNMASHHAAYNMLMVSIMNGEGFMKVVGEVGTGKTILCRKVLNTLSEDERNFETAYVMKNWTNALQRRFTYGLGCLPKFPQN